MTDTLKESAIGGYYNKDVRTFFLYKYEILPSLYIEEGHISFYNDKLFYLKCNGTHSLNEALRTKYGDAEIEIKNTPKTYVNQHTGNEIIKEDIFATETWSEEGSNIKAYNMFSTWHDTKGKATSFSILSIYDIGIYTELNKFEEEFKEKLKEKASKDKLNKLEDL